MERRNHLSDDLRAYQKAREISLAEFSEELGIPRSTLQSIMAEGLGVMENPDRLTLVSKRLYPEVAKRYKTTWTAVERNIRTVVQMAWEGNPKLLCELSGCELVGEPKAAQFIAILALSLLGEPPGG